MPNISNAIEAQYQILYTHFQEMIVILSNYVNDVYNEQQQIDTKFQRLQVSLQDADKNFLSIKASHENIRSCASGMKLTQDLLAGEIWSLKQAADNALSTSYDGTFIWKIPGVRDKIGMH